MALSPRLDVRQTQAPVMTPQLQQAIKLLQLSNLELAAFVETELEENPLLEREDALIEDDAAPSEGESSAGDDGDAAALTERETLSADEAPLDTNYTNEWQDDPFRPAGGGTPAPRGDSDSLPGIDQTMASKVTLREHLTEQLDMSIADPTDRLIGRALIDTLDERGFLSVPLEELAEQLGCETDHVERIVTILRAFEPTGVFARDLIQCFELQLAERDRLDPAMQAMLENLDLLTKHDLARLRRACGVDEEDLADMLAELRTLDPQPASAFEDGNVEYKTPDVMMRAKQGGGWEIELNNDTLPRVLVNRAYYTEISSLTQEKDDKAFVQERFQAANWLVRALDQRARTILKVATEIIRQQDAFFRLGVTHLKPLILADIAEAVKLHESTVSRVTTNKYMATPRGMFELKYFFTTAINNSGEGDMHSAESVRHKIKLLIDNESPKSILSDDKIVEMLRGDGVEIARRTVAKYRDSLKIPSSVERRRMKRAAV
ncbi:MAG: RNA polymerase sigma-54 factor [Alphaproteobacteria bacterium]|nr:RNA polymerase sigma-54 factor [Alphaproteobacteria bacterium]|tara:strand:- start:688 stop:2163 length:1476 start_codon:yes stop_codon:yes gene_type:complete